MNRRAALMDDIRQHDVYLDTVFYTNFSIKVEIKRFVRIKVHTIIRKNPI